MHVSTPIAQPYYLAPVKFSTACKTAGQGLGPNATSLLPVYKVTLVN